MKFIRILKKIRYAVRALEKSFPLHSQFGFCARNVQLNYPVRITYPQNVFVYENCRIQAGVNVINSINEKVIVKKYSVVTANVTIVPGNHISTVTIPQFLLGASHINDKSTDIIIEEDCWVGTGTKLLAGAHLGRGCIIGAGAIVNKDIPPYALAVGSPARIIGVKFNIDQIIEHERALYPEDERLSKAYLDELFSKFYNDLKVFGFSGGIGEKESKLLERLKRETKYVEPY